MLAILYYEFHEEVDLLTQLLQQSGFIVHTTQNLGYVIKNWSKQPYEFILAALIQDASSFQQQIQGIRSTTVAPFILVVDPLPEHIQVKLYQEGIDLLVTRPFSSLLLLQQIRAIARRSNSMPLIGLPILTYANIILNPTSRTVTDGKRTPKHLTQLEFRLLYTLMTHPNQIMSSERLVEQVWGYSGEGNRELIRGLVQRLRIKIEPEQHRPRFIITEPGIGYIFKPPKDNEISNV